MMNCVTDFWLAIMTLSPFTGSAFAIFLLLTISSTISDNILTLKVLDS